MATRLLARLAAERDSARRSRVLNHDDEPFDLTVRIDAGSDFADLFEVKDALEKKGRYSVQEDGGRLVLSYRRSTFARRDGGSRAERPPAPTRRA